MNINVKVQREKKVYPKNYQNMMNLKYLRIKLKRMMRDFKHNINNISNNYKKRRKKKKVMKIMIHINWNMKKMIQMMKITRNSNIINKNKKNKNIEIYKNNKLCKTFLFKFKFTKFIKHSIHFLNNYYFISENFSINMHEFGNDIILIFVYNKLILSKKK